MNNKGFTIIELLAVIIILSLVIILSFTAINNSSNNVTNKLYETKKSNIEDAAILAGQDYKKGGTIKVSKLMSMGYIKHDEVVDGVKIVTDPRGKLSSLNNCYVKVEYNNGKVTAQFDPDGQCK